MKLKPVTLGIAVVAIAAVIGLMLLALNLAGQKGRRPVIGATAPDFTLTLYDGYMGGLPKTVSLASLRGKVVVINFWASWCPPCHKEAVALQRVYERYSSRGVAFLGVDILDTERDAFGYLSQYGVTYANGLDVAQTISSQLYRITGQPETFIVRADGTVHTIIIGETTEADLSAHIEAALAATGDGVSR